MKEKGRRRKGTRKVFKNAKRCENKGKNCVSDQYRHYIFQGVWFSKRYKDRYIPPPPLSAGVQELYLVISTD
jgi:hypothetical protein